MVHFNNKTTYLMDMGENEKTNFLTNIDLEQHDFEIKIADYGLSKRLPDKEFKIKHRCGTLVFMSPQQALKQKYGYKCDIWGIGVVLYYMLMQKAPFDAEYVNELEEKLNNGIYTL